MTQPRPKFTRTHRQVIRSRRLRRSASDTERKLWLHLRSNQIGVPFRRQYAIGPWFADYCCVPLKLVVEIDGPQHDLEKDSSRDDSMRALGFSILRFGVQQVDRDLQSVVDAIYAEVQLELQRREAGQKLKSTPNT